jgi:ATP-dependent RNA helicase RhlE
LTRKSDNSGLPIYISEEQNTLSESNTVPQEVAAAPQADLATNVIAIDTLDDAPIETASQVVKLSADVTPEVKFADFGLADPILRAITEMGYETPTPIQAAAIPIVLQGKDVMGAAQTGTGKTAGFGLPSLQLIMQYANVSPSPARHPTRVLVLAPTRELADQIYVNMREYAKYSGLRAVAVFGGVDIKPQTAQLRAGCEILIATPGRLLDHVEQKTANLSQVQMLVLDEADRMLDMGFLPDIQRIINLLPAKRQNLLFSATFSAEIRKLSKGILNNPVVIEVARANATADKVIQKVLKVPSSDAKKLALANWLLEHKPGQAIIFCNSKIGCSRLARLLQKDGFSADAIHGDKSQTERLATLESFKAGSISLLVATDVAARGLDIPDLPAVINFDLPYTSEDYVHRIGRTGRAGASGIAVSLMAPGDERLLADIEKLIKRKIDVEIAVAAHPEVANFGDRKYGDRGGERKSGEGHERFKRDDNADRPNRSARPSFDSTRRTPVAGGSRDPFFYQPYVETQVAPSVVSETSASLSSDNQPVGQAAKRAGLLRTARPVAMLLGGGKKA